MNVFEAADLGGVSILDLHQAKRYYVYVLVDPRDGSVFYVGKGKNRRGKAHFNNWRAGKVVNADKHNRIEEIVAFGKQPSIFIIANDLNEDMAFAIERQAIASIGRSILTNGAKGRRGVLARTLIEVTHNLRRIIHPAVWLRERPRTPYEIDIYTRIVLSLMGVRDKCREQLGMEPVGKHKAV